MTKVPKCLERVLSFARPGWCLARLAMAAALLLAVSGLRASVVDCSAPLQDVQVEYLNGQVTCQVFDPVQGQWMVASTYTAAANNLINTNGVVAWSSGNVIYCQTYDPFKTNWMTTSALTGDPQLLLNSRGLIAWSTADRVRYVTYDPARGQWMGGEQAPGGPFDLQIKDGLISWSIGATVFLRTYNAALGQWVGDFKASPQISYDFTSEGGVATWSAGNLVHYRTYDTYRNQWTGNSEAVAVAPFELRTSGGVVAWSFSNGVQCRVYDPAGGGWAGTNSYTGIAMDVAITNSTVSWSTGTTTRTSRGYNPTTKTWVNGSTRPLAFFSVSTNSGPTPLFVRFTDMSLGTIAREWDFGSGLKSTDQSPSRTFATPGLSFVKQTIFGVGGKSFTTTNILTDVLAPTNASIVINGGKAFTTNQSVTLTLKATDNGAGSMQMRFSNDKSSWSTWEPFKTNKAWSLAPVGYGQRTVWAQFRDSFENTGEPVSDSILLDTAPPPVARFAVLETNVVEANGTLTIPVQLDHAMKREVSVAFATTNLTAIPEVDYKPAAGVLVFPAGTTVRNVSVEILGDDLVETNKQFQIELLEGSDIIPGPPVTVTILDNDLPTVQFASDTFTAKENAGAGLMNVILSAPSGLEVTVEYAATNGTATAGVDYIARTGTLVFAPGETSATIAIPLRDDALDEGTETVIARLHSSTNALLGSPSIATLLIQDDDPPTVDFTAANYPVTESAGTATAEVRLTKPYGQTVYVDYATGGGTATPGQDYIASNGTLIFPPGQTARTITITLLPGGGTETDETLGLSLSGFVNVLPGTLTATTITILGDDPLKLLPLGFGDQGAFRLRINGVPGSSVLLQKSADLKQWNDLATVPNPTGTAEYADTTALGSAVRYYRARQLP